MLADVEGDSQEGLAARVEELQAQNLVYFDLLQASKSELSSLIEMMDTYYSQGRCYSDAQNLIARINCAMSGPTKPAPPPPPPITCPLCNGAKALRPFKALSDLEMHQHAVHGFAANG